MSSTGCAACLSLIAAHRIIGVNGPGTCVRRASALAPALLTVFENVTLTILLDAAKNVVHIVREKPFLVEHCLDHPRNRFQTHRLVMSMLVPLHVNGSSATDTADKIAEN